MIVLNNKIYNISVSVKRRNPDFKPVSDKNYIYFQNKEGFSSVGFEASDYLGVKFQYSTDGINWQTWTPTRSNGYDVFPDIELANPGDFVFIRATDYNALPSRNTSGCLFHFILTGLVYSGGSVMSLLDSEAKEQSMPANCFQGLFKNCSSLLTPPELPATVLSNYCYDSMFHSCTQLAVAPDLPATIASGAGYAYQYMFYGCSSLVDPPIILLTGSNSSQIGSYTFQYMFKNCTSLRRGVDLQNISYATNYLYREMYSGCSSLTEATTPTISSWNTQYFYNWLSGVAATGTLYAPTDLNNLPQNNTSGLPSGWTISTVQKKIKLTAKGENNLEFNYTINGTGPQGTVTAGSEIEITLTYGDTIDLDGYDTDSLILLDGNATSLVSSVGFQYASIPVNAVFSCIHPGDLDNLFTITPESSAVSVSMTHYGTNQSSTKPNLKYSKNRIKWYLFDGTAVTVNSGESMYIIGDNQSISTSYTNYSRFEFSDKAYVSGDVTTLLIATGNVKALTVNYCFYKLFDHNANLLSAPVLPSIILSKQCYQSMFSYCTSLTAAPEIPATVFLGGTYGSNETCSSMFDHCTSMVTPPSILPCMSLVQHAYSSMFSYCTALTTAPVLPAKTRISRCYNSMFLNCSHLSSIVVGAESWNGSDMSDDWVSGVAAVGTFTKPAETTIPYGTSGIPNVDWTIVNV